MNSRTILGFIKIWWIFYRKILIPASALATAIAILMLSSTASTFLSGIGIAFIITAPFFHYIIYESNNPNEYYFYYNQGLSKKMLWIATIVFSLIVGLTSMLV